MTDLKIVTFDAKAGLKADVVEKARSLLAMAEAGKLVDLCYSAASTDGSMITGFTATDDAPRRLAGVCHLLFRLNSSMDRDAEVYAADH